MYDIGNFIPPKELKNARFTFDKGLENLRI